MGTWGKADQLYHSGDGVLAIIFALMRECCSYLIVCVVGIVPSSNCGIGSIVE